MSATDRAVDCRFTLAETEALAAFVAQHEWLWRAFASECGVRDPMAAMVALAEGHATAVERLAKSAKQARRVRR